MMNVDLYKSGVTLNLSEIQIRQINRNIFFIVKNDNTDLFSLKQILARFFILPGIIITAKINNKRLMG